MLCCHTLKQKLELNRKRYYYQLATYKALHARTEIYNTLVILLILLFKQLLINLKQPCLILQKHTR
jgi:hypothetical protein